MREIRLRGAEFLPRGRDGKHTLDVLLARLAVMERHQLVIGGAAAQCENDEHRLSRWLAGMYAGHYLVLSMCVDCESVEVRDQTRQYLPTIGSPTVNSPDDVLGWYSGARARSRVYL